MSRFIYAFVCAALITASRASADGFDYLKQALDRVVAAADVGASANLDYDGSGCLFGYFMDSGSEQAMIRTLEGGTRYVFVGAGDDDVKDLDIKLYDMDDNKVAEDVEVDAAPVVQFTPKHEGRYKVVLRNHESNGRSFCCFVVLSEAEGHTKFQSNAVTEAMSNVLEWARMHNDQAISFLPNQLIMFGGKVAQGESSDVFDIQLPRGNYMFLARANSVAEDIDCTVTEQDDAGAMAGKKVGEDTESDAIPVCDFRAGRNLNYAFDIKNERSSRPAFMFGLIIAKDR